MSKNGDVEGTLPENSQELWDLLKPLVRNVLRYYGETDENMIQDVEHRTFDVLRKRPPGKTANERYIRIRAIGLWKNLRATDKHIVYVSREVLAEMEDHRDGPEENAILNEFVQHLSTKNDPIISGLIEGKSYERIAEELGKKPHTIEQYASRFRKQLKREAGREKIIKQKEGKGLGFGY